jgi:hypothetical protein
LKKSIGIGALALGALFVVGCGGGSGEYRPVAQAKTEEVPQVDVKQFNAQTTFPFKVGNEWTYLLDNTAANDSGQASREMQVTYKVVKVDGSNAVLELSSPDRGLMERQIWRTTNEGVYQVAVGKDSVPFDKPQPAILFPVEIGRQSTWVGNGINPSGVKSPMTIRSKVLGIEEVDTEVGRFSAVAIEGEVEFKRPDGEGRAINKTWWVPEIGIVRFRQDMAVRGAMSSLTMRLKETNVK